MGGGSDQPAGILVSTTRNAVFAFIALLAVGGCASSGAGTEGSDEWCTAQGLSRSACDDVNHLADVFDESPGEVLRTSREVTEQVNQGALDENLASSPPTFADGSAISDDLVAAGEICDALYPLDDVAFVGCVLDMYPESDHPSPSRGQASGRSSGTTTTAQRATTTTSTSSSSTTTTSMSTTTVHSHPPVSLGGDPYEPLGEPPIPAVSVSGHVDCSGPIDLVVDVLVENQSQESLQIYNIGVGYQAIGHAETSLDTGWTWENPGVIASGSSVILHEHLEVFSQGLDAFPLSEGDWVSVMVDAGTNNRHFVYGVRLTCP